MVAGDKTGSADFDGSEAPVKFEGSEGATAGDKGVVEGWAVSDAESSVAWGVLNLAPLAFDEILELEVALVGGAAETAVTNHKPNPALTSTRPSNEQNLIKIFPPQSLLKINTVN